MNAMKTIFLVHDQLESPFVRQHFLESAGYRVVAMESGLRCLELLDAQPPDLVLMDVLVEGRNGFEVCRRIRSRFSPRQLPVVLCSEIYRSRLFREEALQAGAQRYLLKPVRLDELVSEVHAVLEAARDRAA